MQVLEHVKTINVPDEKVWVVGDLHGNVNWIQSLLPAMRRFDPTIRTLLQLGDYGFEHPRAESHALDFWAKKIGIKRVLVTLGNHEAWGEITPAQEDHPGQAIRVSEVVWFLPRPFRFTVAGRTVLSLGGASSVDKSRRTDGKDWFEDELITEAMVQTAVVGKHADILLTHESPLRAVPEVRRVLRTNPFGYPSEALATSAAQRALVQRVSDAVRPGLHLHGHMHVYGDAQIASGRRVISLARDTFEGSAGVLDAPALAFTPLPHAYIRNTNLGSPRRI